MSEYDNRQYRQMLVQLHAFEAKRIDLKHLINGTRSLLYALEQASDGWKSHFQKSWATLETIYAVALDQERQLSQDELAEINKAVEQMKHLIVSVCPDNQEGEKQD